MNRTFSNSAMTHDVIIGVAFAYKQSISESCSSSFARTVCDRKLVSTRTEYGGTSAVLAWKKSDEGT
jgi:hypothetical protein